MKNVSIVLWTVAAILLLFWVIGMVANMTFGGILHLLLVLIVIAVVIDLMRALRA